MRRMDDREAKPRAAYVCTDCQRPAETFSQPCARRGSRKIEHADFLRISRGPHWKELLQAERGSVH